MTRWLPTSQQLILGALTTFGALLVTFVSAGLAYVTIKATDTEPFLPLSAPLVVTVGPEDVRSNPTAEIVPIGERLTFKSHFQLCNDGDDTLSVTLTYSLIDGIVTELVRVTVLMNPGCGNPYQLQTIAPEGLKPAAYRLRWTAVVSGPRGEVQRIERDSGTVQVVYLPTPAPVVRETHDVVTATQAPPPEPAQSPQDARDAVVSSEPQLVSSSGNDVVPQADRAGYPVTVAGHKQKGGLHLGNNRRLQLDHPEHPGQHRQR